MAANNLGSAWSSMKTITGLRNPKNSSQVTLDGFNSDTELANSLNQFFNRFDTLDFRNEIQDLRNKFEDNQYSEIDQKSVEKAFSSVKVTKSHGPDKICGRLLKFCAKELSPIFHFIFNKSLQTQHVPKVWKDAVVVPVPKSSCPKTHNDFRPIALTSILMKIRYTMENGACTGPNAVCL